MPWYANNRDAGCFAVAPYGAGPSSKGHTLYLQHKLNHKKLFSLLASWRGPWVLTEDNTRMIRRLALCYRVVSKRAVMNTSDNKKKHEPLFGANGQCSEQPLEAPVTGEREAGRTRQPKGGFMKGPMKLVNASSGLMECRVCGSRHFGSLQSGSERANGVTRY